MLYAVKNDDHFLIFSKGNMPAYTNDINMATVAPMSELIHQIFEWGRAAQVMINLGSGMITKQHYFVEAKPNQKYVPGLVI